MTNLFKKLAVFALLITLSGTQITHTRWFGNDDDNGDYYESPRGHGIIGGTLIGAGNITRSTLDTAGATVENTGDTLTGGSRRKQRRKNKQLKEENKRLREKLGEEELDDKYEYAEEGD